MKYAFFDIKEAWEKKLILKKLDKQDVTIFSESIQEVDAKELKNIDVISIFIYSKATAENLKKIPKLKLIATRSTGYDHIDIDYCKKNKVKIASVPYYGENTVAEFTLGLLLNISRKVSESVARVKTGSFDFRGLRGFDLAHKTIGVIGFGRIGQKFAKMCRGLNMKVIAYDPFADKLEETALELGVKLVNLEEIYKKSQIISLHMPLLKETKHIINKDSLKMMKKGVIILNTSRGGLINTKDLLHALDNNKVAFAAMDVLESEGLLKEEYNFLERGHKDLEELQAIVQDHELIKRTNVHVTPHNAFNTQDALERITNTTLENITNFRDNKEIVNLIRLK